MTLFFHDDKGAALVGDGLEVEDAASEAQVGRAPSLPLRAPVRRCRSSPDRAPNPSLYAISPSFKCCPPCSVEMPRSIHRCVDEKCSMIVANTRSWAPQPRPSSDAPLYWTWHTRALR